MSEPKKIHYYKGSGNTTMCNRVLHEKLKRTEFSREVNCVKCIRALGREARWITRVLESTL